eukprot:6473707-Amphidinium_carterae.1
MQGLVTVLCNAECLGAWTVFWRPCRESRSFLGDMFTTQFSVATSRISNLGTELLSKSDTCSLRWQMDRRECMDAVIVEIPKTYQNPPKIK